MTADRISTLAAPVSVAGIQQHLYGVDGLVVGLDEAVRAVELDCVWSTRELILKTGRIVKVRSERLKELNRAQTLLAKVRADMSDLGAKDKYSSPELNEVLTIAARLGLALEISSPAVKGDVTKAYSQLQHEIDLESNRLQQAQEPLSNYITQHDRHFSKLDAMMKKAVGMPTGTVRNLG